MASLSFGVTPTEPMPCTFEWPRIGISPACGPADHAAHQSQVGDRLHVGHAVHMMRDAHRPTEDDVLGRGIAVGDLVDLESDRRPTCAQISVPTERPQMRLERFPAAAMFVEKAEVDRAHLVDPFGDAGQQGQVAADVRLHVQAGDLRAEQQAADVAGHAEIDHARSRSPD